MARGALNEAEDAFHLADIVDGWDECIAPWTISKGGQSGLGLLCQSCDKVVINSRADDHACCRGAILTGVEITGYREPLGSSFNVCIVEDHDRGFSTEFKVDALYVACR